jgi:alpha-L-rhamnosidase
MPLYLGIVPAGREAAVAQNIADNLSANGGHLSIGEVGLKYMTEVLMDYGHAEAIYTMVTKTSHPSWGHDLNLQVVADGVTLDRFTTLVEFWGGGGSHNHIMWGTIDEWYYKALAGIDVNQDEPGYKLITIKPNVVGDLTWAQASVDTIRGTVISDWNKSGNTLTLNVTLPGNSTAKVHVPKIGLSNVTVTENGMTIWQNSSFIAGVAGITAGTEDNNYVSCSWIYR